MDSKQSVIAEWYRGRSILITGATGFMGKVLVEKLLRSCPEVGTIFLLVRKKNDTSSRDRVQKLLTSSLFDDLHAIQANLKDKLIAISGNIGVPDLGISDEDRNLLQESVSVVFHVAATVKFHEPLRRAVTMNVEGTRSVLRLCQGLKNLSAIVHVSTAYANCSLSLVEERVYPAPCDPEKLEHCIAALDDDTLNLITPRLLDRHPNTYTFTKALAEHVVAEYSSDLPIVVVRPSIVSGSWKEPIPGWIDNYNGPTLVMVSAATGLLKSVYGKRETVVDFIPVDVCINLFIAAAWEIGSRERIERLTDLPVYNCVSRPFSPFTWGGFVEEVDRCITNYAVKDIVTSPKLMITDSRLRHTLTNLSNQAFPLLIDCFNWMSGGKPRLQRYQSKINRLAKIYEFFTTQEWDFEVDNVKRLKDRLSPNDRKIFDFDTSNIIWKEYMTSFFLGIRRNIMNEKDETLNAGRKRLSRLSLMSKIVNFGLLGCLTVGVINFYDTFTLFLHYFFAIFTIHSEKLTLKEQYS